MHILLKVLRDLGKDDEITIFQCKMAEGLFHKPSLCDKIVVQIHIGNEDSHHMLDVCKWKFSSEINWIQPRWRIRRPLGVPMAFSKVKHALGWFFL